MVIIGVILLIAGVIALVDMGVSSSGTTNVHILGWHLGLMGPGRVLLLGTVIGVVLTVGLFSVLSGLRRSRRRRRDRDKTIRGTRAENKRLAAQLEETRAAAPVEATPAAASPPTGQVTTGSVDAYPAGSDYRAGSEYVVGSPYPQGTAAVNTPPAPPAV
jgi:uncharacterized membrane protein